MLFSFLPRVSAGSLFSWTVVSAGSKRSRTVSVEAKYDGHSLQESKLSGLVYTLCNHDRENTDFFHDGLSHGSSDPYHFEPMCERIKMI